MKHFWTSELSCLPTLIPMHNRKMMKQQDQFESTIQVDSSTNRDHEIDGNTQTQNAEI